MGVALCGCCSGGVTVRGSCCVRDLRCEGVAKCERELQCV